MNLVFIADFFAEQVTGGGELNNEELIQLLKDQDISVEKINSHLVTPELIKRRSISGFIVSNFVNLHPSCIEALYDKKYVIYEHDHKYLKNRNPATYKEFKAPEEDIINYDFYKNASAVFCQSSFHKGIIFKNLGLENIVSVGGNLWGLKAFNLVRNHAEKKKAERCSVMYSQIPHKNTLAAKAFCIHKGLDFEIIPSLKYYDFLDRISNNDTLVFFPKTPETLSRIVVEARMMGMKVICNDLVGATKEEWFNLKGVSLIDIMMKKREEIPTLVMEALR